MSSQPAPQGHVLVVGSANLDLVATTARHPAPGETLIGRDYAEHPGGKGLNQAVAAARANATTRFVGAVGRDDAGRTLADIATTSGVETSQLLTVDAPTGRALILVADSGENSIVVVPGANDLCPPGIPQAGDVVLTQLEVPLSSVGATLQRAKAVGAVTILNPAPARALPPDLLECVDVIVPNQHELAVLGGREALAAAGVRTLVVTLGADGADLFDGADPTAPAHHVTPFDVVPVDTTGAGDAFCGGLAARLAAGDDLHSALVFAAANGALATTVAGAVPSLPVAAATRALIEDR